MEPRRDGDLVIITIDLEDHFRRGKHHPENDPGVVFYYVIKVDDQRHEVKHRHMRGENILALEGKDPEHFLLEQSIRKDGHMTLIEIRSDQTVDFGTHGVERFITKTKPKVFKFWIGQKDYTTTQSSLTVRQILVEFAEVDPATKTLAKKIEGGFVEYKNLDEIISLENCPHFSVFDNTSLPVS